MKTLYYRTFTAILIYVCCIGAHAVNLDSIEEKSRNKILYSISKEVVMRYGPDYYRDIPKPEIKRYMPVKKGVSVHYILTYLPKPGEYFRRDIAASVTFNAETGLPTYIDFGTGFGYEVSDAFNAYLAKKYYNVKNYKGVNYKKVLKDEVIEPVKYLTVKRDTSRVKFKAVKSIKLEPIGDSTYLRFQLDSIIQLLKLDSINENKNKIK